MTLGSWILDVRFTIFAALRKFGFYSSSFLFTVNCYRNRPSMLLRISCFFFTIKMISRISFSCFDCWRKSIYKKESEHSEKRSTAHVLTWWVDSFAWFSTWLVLFCLGFLVKDCSQSIFIYCMFNHTMTLLFCCLTCFFYSIFQTVNTSSELPTQMRLGLLSPLYLRKLFERMGATYIKLGQVIGI